MKVKFNAHGELFNYNGLSKNNENGTISFRFENVEDVNLLLSFLQDEEAMKTLTFYTDEEAMQISCICSNYELENFRLNYKFNLVNVILKCADIYSRIDNVQTQILEVDTKTIKVAEDLEELNRQVNPAPVNISKLTLEEAKEYQLNIVNEQCQKAIYNGIDLETSVGNEHFSLTQEDQTNIVTLYNQVMSGIVVSVPYHADGELCRQFSAEEMIDLGNAALAFVTYCTTKCNHLRAWIKRATDKDTVLSITFGSELPSDLLDNMNCILNGNDEVADNE